jgi:hypothetical protein
VRVAVPVLLAASRAVTVSTLVPGCSTMPLTDQLVVPAAVPLPPRLLAQETCVTPTLSAAVPASVSYDAPSRTATPCATEPAAAARGRPVRP